MRLIAFAALLLGSAQEPGPMTLPDGFAEEVVARGFTGATGLAVAPDGRVFVAEQTGALRVVKDGRLLSEPFLALKVDSFWERGLIGVALDPGFPRAPYVYVLYVSPDPYPHHRVSRFTASGDVAEAGSERILLEGDDQRKLGGSVPAGHQGGGLRFGPEGALYVGIGEQTAGLPAQKLDTFQGKLLRIRPDGSIPEDNPFFSAASGKYRAIWASGLRNPFAFAFQPGTGRLYINDVGGSLWEEVNEGVAGANYGWPHAEGPSKDPRFRNPVHAYPRGLGKSITGGVFYPFSGGSFPPDFAGKFLFMDYDANWIRVLDPADPKQAGPFASGAKRPVDLAVAPDGSLYVLHRDMWVNDKKFRPGTGLLSRIRRAAGATSSAPRPALPKTAALGLSMNPDRLPTKLSAAGLFRSLAPLEGVDGLEPYEVIAPQWADGASKRRWLALPEGGRMRFAEAGEWTFPAGTLLVEQLDLGGPVETRVLAVDGRGGGWGAAYRWKADGSDAELVEEGEAWDLPGGRRWYSPGPLECLSCHAPANGFVLGLNTRQLPASRLRDWSRRGFFDGSVSEGAPRLVSPSDPSAPLEARARSYLDANCSACHRPGGPGRGVMDARFEVPLARQALVDGALLTGDLGLKDARNVVPGDPARSVLLERMRRRGDPFKMPPVGSLVPDEAALQLLADWIRVLAK